jgi:hypothetical protein
MRLPLSQDSLFCGADSFRAHIRRQSTAYRVIEVRTSKPEGDIIATRLSQPALTGAQEETSTHFIFGATTEPIDRTIATRAPASSTDSEAAIAPNLSGAACRLRASSNAPTSTDISVLVHGSVSRAERRGRGTRDTVRCDRWFVLQEWDRQTRRHDCCFCQNEENLLKKYRLVVDGPS